MSSNSSFFFVSDRSLIKTAAKLSSIVLLIEGGVTDVVTGLDDRDRDVFWVDAEGVD